MVLFSKINAQWDAAMARMSAPDLHEALESQQRECQVDKFFIL